MGRFRSGSLRYLRRTHFCILVHEKLLQVTKIPRLTYATYVLPPVNFPDPFSRSVQTLTSLTGRFSFLSCLGENILTGIEDCEIGPTTIVCCARIKTKIFKTTTNDSNIYLKEQFSTVSISNQRFFLLLLNFAP